MYLGYVVDYETLTTVQMSQRRLNVKNLLKLCFGEIVDGDNMFILSIKCVVVHKISKRLYRDCAGFRIEPIVSLFLIRDSYFERDCSFDVLWKDLCCGCCIHCVFSPSSQSARVVLLIFLSQLPLHPETSSDLLHE